MVRATPSNATGGTRGLFHSISVQKFSLPLLQQIANQSAYWGTRPLRSGLFISYDVEPFLQNWANNADGKGKTGAWPHDKSPLPLNIYFAWTSPLDDGFYRDAALESARVLRDFARAEGQDLEGLYIYPNYALAGTPSAQVYGTESALRLTSLKKVYDPSNVMGLTTYLPFQ